MKNYIGSIK